MPWWIAGATTTSSRIGPYKVQVIGSCFEDVHRTVIYRHRECDTVQTITSPEGIEMTEAEFYSLWKAEKSSKNA